MEHPRILVLGAGIVGSAVARALTAASPGGRVTVLEKEDRPGLHQTARNSGVVHAGLYYAPGSAKARLSREGVERLRGYCRERGLPYEEVGKVVVATSEQDERRLRGLEARATANGVPGLRWLGREELREIEPHVSGRAALHSPTTAVVDFARIARSFLDDAVAAGAQVRTGVEVVAVRRADGPGPDPLPGERSPVSVLSADGRRFHADRLVVAAGLHADRLARLAGDGPYPRIVPFRGEYHRLAPAARHLVRGLVYPVPDPRYPFLGVHLTRRVDGEVLVGPNAVLALAREGYGRGDVEARELAELVAFPGFWRFAGTNARAGLAQMVGSWSEQAFLEAARAYVPELTSADLEPAPAGVRAQAMDRDGSLVEDFRFSRVGPVLCVRNAPSPAATASLAIADRVVRELGLTQRGF